MRLKNKKNILRYFKRRVVAQSLFLFFVVSISCFFAIRVQGEDCSLLEGDARDKCEELEKKAKVYQNIIDIKNAQQDTLAQQMQLIDRDQAKNKSELELATARYEELTSQIDKLEKQIEQNEKNIQYQKTMLIGLMQFYYDYDKQGMLDLILFDRELSEIMKQSDGLEQSQVKVKDVIVEIKQDQEQLSAGRESLMAKKKEIEEIKNDLTYKKYNLDSTEQQKQSLLSKTQGEEEKYQQLLARVEEQKKELFNFSEAANIDEIRASVDNYPKPTTNLASTTWYFAQGDSRWGKNRIGNSSSLMEDYGCAISCVAMVFKQKGVSIDPGMLAKQKIFYYDLIVWPDSWSAGISLISSTSHGNINWRTIDSEIAKGNPVIVYIGKTNGRGGHYVVVTGKDSKDYIVHDPYFGANLYLGTSKSLVGKIGIDSGVRLDQMIIYKK